MSTDSGQISLNNLGKVDKNAKTNIFIDFLIDFFRDFFFKDIFPDFERCSRP